MKHHIRFEQLLRNQCSVPTKLLTSYKKLSIDETELVIILQIHRFLQEGKDFPTLSEISNSLTINEQKCAFTLRKLIQKELLIIESQLNDQNQIGEYYSLEPLWEKLFKSEEIEETEEKENHIGTLFIVFEQEFGRPLSPFEIEMINSWLDEDSCEPALIKAALRESVLMSKLNFKYIDRILQEWKRIGIHSVEQAREESKKFRKSQITKGEENTSEERKDRSFYYNWLEDDE